MTLRVSASELSNQAPIPSPASKRVKKDVDCCATGLPLDIQHKILSLLSACDLVSATCVSKAWKAAFNAKFWNLMRKDLKIWVNEKEGEKVKDVVLVHLKWVAKWQNNEYCAKVIKSIVQALPDADRLAPNRAKYVVEIKKASEIQPASEAAKAIAAILLSQDHLQPAFSLWDLVAYPTEPSAKKEILDFFLFFQISFNDPMFAPFVINELSPVDFNSFLGKVVLVVDTDLKARDPKLKNKKTAFLHEIAREGRLFLFEKLLEKIRLLGDLENMENLVKLLIFAIRKFDITATEVVDIIQSKGFNTTYGHCGKEIFQNFLKVLAPLVQEEAKKKGSVEDVD